MPPIPPHRCSVKIRKLLGCQQLLYRTLPEEDPADDGPPPLVNQPAAGGGAGGSGGGGGGDIIIRRVTLITLYSHSSCMFMPMLVFYVLLLDSLRGPQRAIET
jgi:hypothetical protein